MHAELVGRQTCVPTPALSIATVKTRVQESVVILVPYKQESTEKSFFLSTVVIALATPLDPCTGCLVPFSSACDSIAILASAASPQ